MAREQYVPGPFLFPAKMSYNISMNTSELSLYKEKLIAEEKRLRAELESLGRIDPTNPGNWEATYSDISPAIGANEVAKEPDPTDQADLIEEYEARNSTEETLEVQYHTVEKALARIENGTYGICEVGEPHAIEPARLSANPAATTCTVHMR